jgi:hypothetical protein
MARKSVSVRAERFANGVRSSSNSFWVQGRPGLPLAETDHSRARLAGNRTATRKSATDCAGSTKVFGIGNNEKEIANGGRSGYPGPQPKGKTEIRVDSAWSIMKMRSKLNALLLGVSCASSLLLGCHGSRDPQKIPVVVDSAPLAGVEIIAPGDPRFDQEARQIVGAKLDLVKTLSPLLMLIRNNSQHTIVAYSPEWDLKRGTEEIPFVALRTFPMAIAGPVVEGDLPRDREIRPGEERLEGMNSEVGIHPDDASSDAKYQAEDLAGVTVVKAHLDAVIFDDGTLVGPDRHNLLGKFVPYVEDHQSLYRSILASLRAGESAEKLYDSLEQKRRKEFDESRNANPPWNPIKMEKLLAEQDVLGAWRNHGNSDLLAYFSRCLRTPPFAVTRKN